MAVSKDEILEAISNMSVMDVVDLIKEMEDKFGVTAAAAVAADCWIFWCWDLSRFKLAAAAANGTTGGS